MYFGRREKSLALWRASTQHPSKLTELPTKLTELPKAFQSDVAHKLIRRQTTRATLSHSQVQSQTCLIRSPTLRGFGIGGSWNRHGGWCIWGCPTVVSRASCRPAWSCPLRHGPHRPRSYFDYMLQTLEPATKALASSSALPSQGSDWL